MSRQSLPGVLITVLLVSTWTILKVDALAKAKLDDVCQELYQNLDTNSQTVNLDILKVCIKRWGERLHRTPNDYTIRLQYNRMQTFLDANGPSHPRVPPARPPSPGGSKHGQVALKQPNMMVAAHQPQEGQSKTKRLKVEPPARPWDFIHRQQQPVPYLMPKSPQATASKLEQATGARPAASEKFEQPNKVAGVQQPQSSVASICDVRFELRELLKDLPPRTRLNTLSSDCMKLIGNLFVTPNSPIPTANELKNHHFIVQDCAKVWEKLRDNAVNDHNKQTGLERELGLIKVRLEQIKARINERKRKRPNDGQDRQPNANLPKVAPPSSLNFHRLLMPNSQEAARIDACHQLARYPQNLETATMGQMQKYKTDLEDCILMFDRYLARKEETKETKKWILMVEQGTMKAELTRVEDLIKGQSQDQGQNVAAGSSQGKRKPSGSQVTQLQAKLPKVAPQSALNPLNRLQPKLKNLPSAALGKEPGPSGGGSYRNFDIPWRHRSKHSKKMRNRMVKSKPKLL